MSDLSNSNWSELASANTAIAPNGLKDGESPNKLAGISREHWAAEKRFYNQINAIYTSTGSANAYVLTFTQAPEALRAGMKFAFIPNFTSSDAATLNINGLGAKAIVASDGSVLAPNAIVANNSVVVVYNGTSFLLETGSNSPVFSGTVKAGAIAAPTFTGNTTVSNGNLTVNNGTLTITNYAPIIQFVESDNSNKTWFAAVDGGAFSLREDTTATTRLQINANGDANGFLYMSNKVFHAGNDGAGSTLDADLLDGQQGSFYQNATNLNAGTIADARLPTTMGGKTFTGNIILPQFAGTNQFETGTADGASYTNYNFALKGHWGLGMKTYDSTVNGYYDFRVGKWDTKGGFYKNGIEMWHAGNDGAGSGLDADLLDGQSGAFYQARANHTGAQAISTITNLQATLDGKQASLGFTPVNLAGDLMTGSLEIKMTTPTLWLHYPSVKRGRWVVDSGGTLIWQDQGGQNHFYIQNNGAVWTQQLGDLNTRIEQRAAAYADDRRNWCVTDSRMAGYTQVQPAPSGGGNWENNAYVVTLINRVQSDSYLFGARQPQLYIANRGWYAAFTF